jgi:hypothetical protein
LKRSRGLKRVERHETAALACSIETPAIEPDVSTMRIVSRGKRSRAPSRARSAAAASP